MKQRQKHVKNTKEDKEMNEKQKEDYCKNKERGQWKWKRKK